MKIISRVHERFGDFWWWSLCLFVAMRFGDLINAFVGLWLVPKYVPQDELGAVLPLLQMTSTLGLPISILVVTFTKFLNVYFTRGENGKVKTLIRNFWGWTAGAVAVGSVVAAVMLPHFFERIRVVSGSLGFLIVFTAVTTTVSPMFSNALQAVKKFRACTVMSVCSAPIRLAVMLVTMPFRALSGYLLGQSAPSVFSVLWSCFSLRREVGKNVVAVPLSRADALKMAKYAGFVALSFSGGMLLATVQPLVIRQRLPEVESAGYYIISRFADISTYLGQTLVFVLFPFVSEAHVESRSHARLVGKAMVLALGFGCLCSLGWYLLGGWLFGLFPVWRAYAGYSTDMALLSLILTFTNICAIYITTSGARDDFSYLWWHIPICLANAVALVCLMGVSFFRGILPDAVVDFVRACDFCSLRNYLWLNLAFAFLMLAVMSVHFLTAARAAGKSGSKTDRRGG